MRRITHVNDPNLETARLPASSILLGTPICWGKQLRKAHPDALVPDSRSHLGSCPSRWQWPAGRDGLWRGKLRPNNGDEQVSRQNAPLLDGSQTSGADEHLQLNESSLWQGSRANRLNPRAHDAVPEIRKLLLESQGLDGARSLPLKSSSRTT